MAKNAIETAWEFLERWEGILSGKDGDERLLDFAGAAVEIASKVSGMVASQNADAKGEMPIRD